MAKKKKNTPFVMRTIKMIVRTIKWSVLFFIISSVLAVVIYKWVPVPFTPLMGIRAIQQVTKGEKVRLHHKWVGLEEMSVYMPVAVIASEDQNFLKHHGFDVTAIAKAVQEQENGGKRRGASTISQQTAKNVFLWPSSTWIRKGFETYFTVLIELIWSKERIIEVYLNSIEMGDGLYGTEAVAKYHFGKTAKELTRQECATIAATLPNPLRFDSAHPSKYVNKRTQWTLKQMKHIQPLQKEN